MIQTSERDSMSERVDTGRLLHHMGSGLKRADGPWHHSRKVVRKGSKLVEQGR
ncbi:hypothetical protein ACRALDRAFT_208850 [Sodiomyces alcalophilus JCM 7366]|uniref:uncharacterized protein n=1 Tax=Sodiomyces alcalophilus JCM 7366 TaxID=591952 RepID=UPI0039B40BA0